MSSAPDFNEVILARKIRRVLDEGAAQVSDTAATRLAAARQLAMSRKKAAAPAPVSQPVLIPALAGPAHAGPRPSGPTRAGRTARLRLWLPLAALVAALFGVAHWEDQQRVAELASLDAEVLSDALPLDAYLDHGFNEYLARSR